ARLALRGPTRAPCTRVAPSQAPSNGLLLARECPFPISQRPSVDPRFRRELRGGQAAIPPTLDPFRPFLSPDPTSGRVRGLHARNHPSAQPRTSRTRLAECLRFGSAGIGSGEGRSLLGGTASRRVMASASRRWSASAR